MICNMVFSGQVRPLSIFFQVDPEGQIMHHLMHFGEKNTNLLMIEMTGRRSISAEKGRS